MEFQVSTKTGIPTCENIKTYTNTSTETTANTSTTASEFNILPSVVDEAKKNSFHDYQQRDYDFEKLEKLLLANPVH